MIHHQWIYIYTKVINVSPLFSKTLVKYFWPLNFAKFLWNSSRYHTVSPTCYTISPIWKHIHCTYYANTPNTLEFTLGHGSITPVLGCDDWQARVYKKYLSLIKSKLNQLFKNMFSVLLGEFICMLMKQFFKLII
jgi:hypothetical protein